MSDDLDSSFISTELVPDLTKALKLFRSRFAVIQRSIRQPFEDNSQLLRKISLEESELIAKYKSVDKNVLREYHMQFHRLFCRIMEVVQMQRTEQLQGYIGQVEGIICSTISDRDNQADYIKVLAKIYGKGRNLIRELTVGKESEGQGMILGGLKSQQTSLNASRVQKKVVVKQTIVVKGLSHSVKLLNCLDLDTSYQRDCARYIPHHQQKTLSDFLFRNKFVADDINRYRRCYTEGQIRSKKKPASRGRMTILSRDSLNSALMSGEKTKSPDNFRTSQERTGVEQSSVIAKYSSTQTGFTKNYPALSYSKQNSKHVLKDDPKPCGSFRQVCYPPMSKDISPKKTMISFNNIELNPIEQPKPSFSVRRKGKQSYQTRIKLKATSFQVMISGRRIEEEGLDFALIKRRLNYMDSKPRISGTCLNLSNLVA